jgi:hypothetical protein
METLVPNSVILPPLAMVMEIVVYWEIVYVLLELEFIVEIVDSTIMELNVINSVILHKTVVEMEFVNQMERVYVNLDIMDLNAQNTATPQARALLDVEYVT